ncbi:MAG: metallophosphoesterase, partial [Pseudomonadota bacterium]
MRFHLKDKVHKTILVISDLHLGAGVIVSNRFNFLEDFHYDKELVELLQFYSTGDYAYRDVELVVNGDFFDFLAVPFIPYFDDMFWSEDAALEKLKMIIAAHPQVIEGMIHFLQTSKKEIVYTLGNHDGEIILPAVKKYLK